MSENAKSWGHPAFAKDFPANDELTRLVDAFARGDYATVRADAPKLAASTDDVAVKRAANTLRRRIEPDPTSKVLLALAALLLAFLSLWWVTHDGPPPDEVSKTIPAPPPPKLEHIEK